MKGKPLSFSLCPLDRRLVVPKPLCSIEEDRALTLEREGRLIITRKNDGYGHLLVRDDSTAGVHIHTRTGNEVTTRYPQLVRRLEKLRLPRETLLNAELCLGANGKDDVGLFSKVAKSSPKNAAALQEKIGEVRCRIFNIFVHRNRLVTSLPYQERLALIEKLFTHCDGEIVSPVELVQGMLSEAKSRVRKEVWEGLVLYDKNAETAIALDSNHDRPPRPVGCWKWKPRDEDDFIVRKWERGTRGKRHENRMGKLFLSQINPDTGIEVDCGEVGLGFDDAERDFFANDDLYPMVVQIEFEYRFPSGACRNSEFVRVRDDKSTEACVLPEELRTTAIKPVKK